MMGHQLVPLGWLCSMGCLLAILCMPLLLEFPTSFDEAATRVHIGPLRCADCPAMGRGGRGRGRQGAAKAKGKSTAGPAKPAQPAELKRSSSTASLEEEGSGKKRRFLGRRDTDEQVERACSHRLSSIPKSIWASKTNKEGHTVVEVITNEIRSKRGDGGKLGSRFWTSLFAAFDLHDNLASTLPDPPRDDDPPPEELLECLAKVHNENPCKVSTLPLERFLEYSQSLSATATFGLLNAVQVGPSLPHRVACRAQLAVLKFWARSALMLFVVQLQLML
jgi:hypothetical protein